MGETELKKNRELFSGVAVKDILRFAPKVVRA